MSPNDRFKTGATDSDLRLDSNQIAFINERAFAGLNYLKHLSLRDNQLTILPNNLLDGVPAIHYLDLHSNKLETLTSANVRSIIHNLYNVTGYLNIATSVYSGEGRGDVGKTPNDHYASTGRETPTKDDANVNEILTIGRRDREDEILATTLFDSSEYITI
ncbi:hypothetical protein Trydic_g7466 [Trypoxylus dichotomus]